MPGSSRKSCRGQARKPTTATRNSPAWSRLTSTSILRQRSLPCALRRDGGPARDHTRCRPLGAWCQQSTLSDIEWGVGVAWTAGQALAAAAQDFLPQNERGEMTEKILAYVRRKHPVKPRDIQQFLKGRLRSKDIKDILSQLVEAGEVEWQGDEYQPTAK